MIHFFRSKEAPDLPRSRTHPEPDIFEEITKELDQVQKELQEMKIPDLPELPDLPDIDNDFQSILSDAHHAMDTIIKGLLHETEISPHDSGATSALKAVQARKKGAGARAKEKMVSRKGGYGGKTKPPVYKEEPSVRKRKKIVATEAPASEHYRGGAVEEYLREKKEHEALKQEYSKLTLVIEELKKPKTSVWRRFWNWLTLPRSKGTL